MGNVDYVSLEKLVLKQINDGVDGLLLLGKTAEISSLSDQEQIIILF